MLSTDGTPLASILRRFDFDHVLMSMSVLVRTASAVEGQPRGTIRAYVKGSFERVAAVCNPATVPPSMVVLSQNFALAGGCVVHRTAHSSHLWILFSC